MKIKTIFFLLLFIQTISYSQNQSILDFFAIKEIKQIEITSAPDMGIDTTTNKVVKISKDPLFIKTVTDILNKYPAGRTWLKKFSFHTPTCRMKITDKENKTHDLIFIGTLLVGPDR
ncbi:MAG: hypothetical protein AB8F94_05735 [Saprospiraceae bacterium]